MAADLQNLAEEFVRDPSRSNREAVVLGAIPLVRMLVGKVGIPDHPLASREDLENAGILGLLQALDSYDPQRGTAFASYIFGRVRGALVDYLRSIDALPREQRRRLAEAQQAMEVLRQMIGDEPDDQDVADYLGISINEYHDLLVGAQQRFSLSLSMLMGEDEDTSPLESIENPSASEDHERFERDSLMVYVNRIITQLPPREQNILALYYHEDLTLREIASLLELTEARISQILGKILLNIRTRLKQTRTFAEF